MCSQTDFQANNSTNTAKSPSSSSPPSPLSSADKQKTQTTASSIPTSCSSSSSSSKTSKTRRSESASPQARRSDYDSDDEDLMKQNMSTSSSSNGNYQVSLSMGFILTTLFLSTLVAYHAGTVTRQNILQSMNGQQTATATAMNMSPRLHQWLRIMVANSPETSSTTDVQTEDAWIHCQEDQRKQQENHLCNIQSEKDATEASSSSSSSSSDSSDDDDDDDEEEENEKIDGLHMNSEPVGQHMLLDFGPMQFSYEETVSFLVQRAASKGWSLQSYHQQCKKKSTATSNNINNNKQADVCIMVFDNGNRMAFHSQANALDIYGRAKDEEALLSWLDHLAPLNVSRWAFQPRGTPWGTFDAGLEDMYNGLLGSLDYTYKSLVRRETTAFQEISFYDTINPALLEWESYQKSLSTTEDNYYTRNAHLFQPDRQMFLDGVVQSRAYGEKTYHEALVHPSMLAHPNPERVAIIGAGEGATLREVLKHSTVKEVIMIEIDSTVMELSRKYLPSWNDCSDFILPEGMTNPTGNCFDDPRAKVYSEDAIRWFVDRYYDNDGDYEPFDIIIMDALDPGDKVEFSDMLFDNIALVETFYRALSPDGIFLSQTGEEQYLDDPNPIVNRDIYALLFQQNLAKVGFSNVRDYEEASTRFDGIWSFLLASKGDDSSRWFANAAQIDLELHRRAIPTKSGIWPFHYFDGATMASYQHASRPVAEVTCRTFPHWPSCQRGAGLVGSQNIALDDALTLQEDGTVIAQRDIEPGTYVGLEQCVQGIFHIPHTTADIIASSSSPQWDAWKTLISDFSMPTPLWGQHAIDVDLGGYVLTHQCPSKKSFLEDLAKGEVNEMYNNFWRTHSCAARRASKETIKAGSEIACGVTF